MPRGNIKMTYFLQYGTSILDRTLERRIDSLRLEGQGRLSGWRMDLSREAGQPNLVLDATAKTWGLLYLIEESKLAELDKVETGTRQDGECYFEGNTEKCVFYSYPSQPGRPNAEFLKALRSAYEQASLPQAQIDAALGIVAKA